MAAPEFDKSSRLFISTAESALVRMLKKYGDHRFTGFPSRRSASAATPAGLPGWTCVCLALLISPALASQQLRQLYRVSRSSLPIARYFSRSPWVHFQ